MTTKKTEENTDKKVEKKVKEVAPKKPKKLTKKEQIENLWQENAELKDKWVRVAAEFENFRRRSTEEKSTWIKNATERLVLEVCDVLDNFERALHPELEKTEMEAFQKGIELIYQQLDNIIKKEGVEKIDTNEQLFDPNVHEALAHIPSELDENKIVAVIQNGYKMNKKVIRPARVAVSNGIKPEAEATTKIEKNN